MREDLKQLIRNYLNVNGFDVSKADDLIDEYESEQTFTELKMEVLKWSQEILRRSIRMVT